MKREIKTSKVKCPSCDNIFEAFESQIFVPKGNAPGLRCKECTKLMQDLTMCNARLETEKNPNQVKKLSELIQVLRKRLKV